MPNDMRSREEVEAALRLATEEWRVAAARVGKYEYGTAAYLGAQMNHCLWAARVAAYEYVLGIEERAEG